MVIGMIRHILVSESGTVLRAMLAATLADAAGARGGAGAEWDMYPGGGHSDSGRDLRRRGDAIYVYEGTYGENVDVNKRLTLIYEGADVYSC